MDTEKQQSELPPAYSSVAQQANVHPSTYGQPNGQQYGIPIGQPYAQPYQQPYGQPNWQTYPQDQTTVVIGQPTSQSVVVVQQEYMEPPNPHTCFSCFVFWFCNCLLGLVAFIYSSQSSSAAARGEIESARMLGRNAKSISAVGLVIGIATYIFLIVYFLV